MQAEGQGGPVARPARDGAGHQHQLLLVRGGVGSLFFVPHSLAALSGVGVFWACGRQGVEKDASTVLIGTSPEFDIARAYRGSPRPITALPYLYHTTLSEALLSH